MVAIHFTKLYIQELRKNDDASKMLADFEKRLDEMLNGMNR